VFGRSSAVLKDRAVVRAHRPVVFRRKACKRGHPYVEGSFRLIVVRGGRGRWRRLCRLCDNRPPRTAWGSLTEDQRRRVLAPLIEHADRVAGALACRNGHSYADDRWRWATKVHRRRGWTRRYTYRLCLRCAAAKERRRTGWGGSSYGSTSSRHAGHAGPGHDVE
jgi:hypothetical protein